MKARDTVFSLVAGSPCPGAVYINSLTQLLGEESSGQSIYPSVKCWIALVISIIEDWSNQLFPTTFFVFKICETSLKVNYFCTIILPESWIKMNNLESGWTELTFLVLGLLTANWLHQIATMFIALWDNSGVKGPHRAFNPACCSKHGQLSGQPRLLRVLVSQVMKTSKGEDYTTSLSNLFHCPIVLMGKSFFLYPIGNSFISISLKTRLSVVSSLPGFPTLFPFRAPPMGSHLSISWMNQSLVACSPRSVPSYSPSSPPSGSSTPLFHGY